MTVLKLIIDQNKEVIVTQSFIDRLCVLHRVKIVFELMRFSGGNNEAIGPLVLWSRWRCYRRRVDFVGR